MILALLLAATPADYLPCRVGLSIEYDAYVDRVLGPDRRGLCRIERRDAKTGEIRETYLRELLSDRVLAAGLEGSPVAFRPPILKGPIEVGTRWRFNRAEFRIIAVGACADPIWGTRCVSVQMSAKGRPSRTSVYALGIGLVAATFDGGQTRAVAVKMPKGETRTKTRTGTRP